jgi:hypothetical protein
VSKVAPLVCGRTAGDDNRRYVGGADADGRVRSTPAVQRNARSIGDPQGRRPAPRLCGRGRFVCGAQPQRPGRWGAEAERSGLLLCGGVGAPAGVNYGGVGGVERSGARRRRCTPPPPCGVVAGGPPAGGAEPPEGILRGVPQGGGEAQASGANENPPYPENRNRSAASQRPAVVRKSTISSRGTATAGARRPDAKGGGA